MKTLVRHRLGLLVVIAMTAAACNSQKAPAEAALKAAQDAYAKLSAEAQKYIPDQAKSVQDALSAAQAAAAKQDYAAVLAAAQPIPAKITELGAAIGARKVELTKTWADLSGSVPKMVTAVTNRLSTLSRSKTPPKGVTRATITTAKSGLASAKTMWSDAMSAASAGDMAAAAAKATQVKDNVVGLMQSLKMPMPKGGV